MRGRRPVVLCMVAALAAALAPGVSADAKVAPPAPRFGAPGPVLIEGYTGDAMEPFVSPDGKYLFFNTRNDPGTDTNLLYARKVTKTKFRFVGPVTGANSPTLDAVPTTDVSNNFYFVSTRSYDQTRSTIYRATFSNGSVSAPVLVAGVSRGTAPWVNFDVDISRDGSTMYFVDSQFNAAGTPLGADLVIAQKTASGFTRLSNTAQLLANVNTPGALEYAAATTKDGRTLFFTRATLPLGSSPPTILVATRASKTAVFGTPTPLTSLTGFVEGPALSRNGRILYFHKLVGSRYVVFSVSKL